MISWSSLLFLIDANETFINIYETSEERNFTKILNSNLTEASFSLEYLGYPVPTLLWRDIYGNEIPRQNDGKHRFLAYGKQNGLTTVKIKHPRVSDSGNYTLHAKNGRMEKEQKFELYVKGMFEFSLIYVHQQPNLK